MAVAPLFLADMDALRGKLRLTGVPDSSDANSALDEAILVARAGIYARLGLSRVSAILAFTSTDVPTTENEVLRTVAESMEAKWVRMELSRTLPVLFMDSAAQRDQAWNEEGTFRAASQSGLEAERRRLSIDIERAMELLSGDTVLGSRTTIKGMSIVDDGDRPWPGHTISNNWPTDPYDT